MSMPPRSYVAGPAASPLYLAEPITRRVYPGTIVIVDHDAAVRDALSVTLAASGFDVLAFSSAGALLRALPIELAVCYLIDFDLEDMTASQLMDQLDARGVAAPALLMSAHLRAPMLQRDQGRSATSVLQKPFGQDELMRSIWQALNGPRSRIP